MTEPVKPKAGECGIICRVFNAVVHKAEILATPDLGVEERATKLGLASRAPADRRLEQAERAAGLTTGPN